MRVLDTEANFLGLRRSQFLELLFLRAIGLHAITRLPMAPTYELKRDELVECVKYLWYIRKELKKLVDDYMLHGPQDVGLDRHGLERVGRLTAAK
jgi:hypothetical protein